MYYLYKYLLLTKNSEGIPEVSKELTVSFNWYTSTGLVLLKTS